MRWRTSAPTRVTARTTLFIPSMVSENDASVTTKDAAVIEIAFLHNACGLAGTPAPR